MQDLRVKYGRSKVPMSVLHDRAGVLRLAEKKRVTQWLERFQVSFPELFLSVCLVSLDEKSDLREVGVWMLNHGVFEGIIDERSNEGGVILVVDVNARMVSISYGYLLDSFLTEDDTFKVLAAAHPYWLQGNHLKALGVVVKRLSAVLQKRSRTARRHFAHVRKRIEQGKEEL